MKTLSLIEIERRLGRRPRFKLFRHRRALRLAVSLLGDGWTYQEVRGELRRRYGFAIGHSSLARAWAALRRLG
jgi:hypothetical protein